MKRPLLTALEILLVVTGIILIATGIFSFAILVLFILAWVSLHLRGLGWRDLGLRRPATWLGTIVLALLIGVGYQALDTLAIGPLLQKLTGEAVNFSQFDVLRGNLPALVYFLILTWTEAAFLEEMFFRGYLFNRIQDFFGEQRLGLILALLLQAVFFGLGHTYQDLTGVLDTALTGFLFGLLYLANRRNLWLPILVHGIIDTTGFLLIYLGLGS